MVVRSKNHVKALEAMQAGDEAGARKSFQLALKKSRGNVVLLVDFGRFLLGLYEVDEAIDLFRKAGLESRWGADVRVAIGRGAFEGRRPELALKFLRSGKEDAGCLVEEATVLEKLNEVEAAAEVLGRGEALGGETVESQLLAGRLAMRKGDAGRSYEVLDRLRGGLRGNSRLMARVHYGRGAALDRLGEYRRAYQAWEMAKEELRPMAFRYEATAKAMLEDSRYCIERLDAGVLETWREWRGDAGVESVMITGYPRSGTTLVERRLEGVTGYASADENRAFAELVARRSGGLGGGGAADWDFLNSEAGVEDAKFGGLGENLADYQGALRVLAGVGADAGVVFDKNPQFLLNLPIMLRYLPQMPVVLVRRDPRDVMLSCFRQDFGLNSYSVNYLTMKRLGEHLGATRKLGKRLEEVLGEQAIACRYEDVVRDEAGEMGRVGELVLGACGREVGAGDGERASYSPTYAEVAKPVHGGAVGGWENYREWIEPCVGPVEKFLE